MSQDQTAKKAPATPAPADKSAAPAKPSSDKAPTKNNPGTTAS